MAQDQPRTRSHLLCLVFTDLVESTALRSRIGDAAAGERIDRYAAEVRRLVAETHGREIDNPGDGFFLSYEAPSDAVTFALRLQLIHHDDPDLPKVRIGLHLGEVTEREAPAGASKPTLLQGLAVDVASRIGGLAMAGQVLMTRAVFDAVRQRLTGAGLGRDLAWRAHGAYLLKGIEEPLELGEAGFEGISPLEAPPDSEKARRRVAAGDEATLGWRPAVGLSIPKRPHWRLEEQLGTGAIGEVWVASHEKTHAKRVFKFCFQADRVRGLRREVVLLRLLQEKLGARRDIAQVVDWEFEHPPYFLEEEHTQAGDLIEWAGRRSGIGQVPLATRLEVIAQIADALAAAHGAGVLHKDLKPANILITDDNSSGVPRACLTDFGIGLVISREALAAPGVTVEGLTETLLSSSSSSGAGTRLYMAPELLEGKAATPLSDVYSLGVILYQMAVGDLSRALAPGWEEDVGDPLLRADIAACVDGHPERRLSGPEELATRLRTREARAARFKTRRRRRRATVGIVTTLLLAFVGFQTARFLQNRSNVRWAHEKALPEILRLADEEQYVEAFGLARTAQQYIPEDPLLSQAWERISSEITVNTDPPGATVSYREYADGGQDWLQLGRTPLDVRVPIGVFRWRIEKQGYQTREVAFAVADRTITTFVRALTQQLSAAANLGRLDLGLDPNGTVPSGMVPVEPALFVPAALIGFQAPPVQLERFWIDRTEVTNAQFKEFVDAGGYETPEFWPSEFEKDGRHLSWEEAMSLFQDSTGSRGPATWAQGEYKTGHGSFPVGGVSWYEAAAYAAFRGMELPTIYHWAHAALGSSGDLLTEAMVGSSNFADAPGPVGRHAGISAAGANDMAGNVSEWLWNSDGAGQHYVLGGAWSEPSYTFVQPGLESPWRRPSSRGFRCVSYPKGNPEDSLKAPLPLLKTDFRAVPEVSDAVFEAMSSPGAYGPMPLNAVLESATRSPDGREEHITLDAAYRGERLPLTIQFPDGASPPYQSVVFFPGMNGLILTDRRASDALEREALRLFLKGGRAVVRPTYSDMYERNDGRALERLYSHETWNLVFRWRQDLGRVLDYLEEREDMDGGRVAYVGLSLGGLLAPFFLPGERFQAALLWSGGLERYAAEQAAIARVAFLKRTMTPVLMLNGRYDSLLQFEQQKVMFSLLGTPEGEKRHVVYDAGHWPLPAKELIQENLAWLDRYLGTVQKRNPRGDRRGPTGRP